MTAQWYEDFKRENPHLKEALLHLELVRQESPRGAVLISTGLLEEQLKKVLLAFFIMDKTSDRLVDGGNAPLSSFSSRISACFALGLITEDEHHDLQQIRHMRNSFAHHMTTSFETQSVVDRCKTLRLKAHDYTSEELGEVRLSSYSQFSTAAVSLIMRLVNRPHYVSKHRRNTQSWPS